MSSNGETKTSGRMQMMPSINAEDPTIGDLELPEG